MNSFPSHLQLAVILGVSFAVQFGGLVVLGVLAHRMGRMVAEAQRLTRAVAGLVVQEEEKTQALLRPAP
jgi:threonine/homoserine/homoserine lactone efflux protein